METNSSAARFGFARRVSRLRSTRTEVGWSWHHPSPLILSLSKDCSFLCAVADDARRTRAVLRQAQHEQSGVGWGGTGLAPSTTARPWRSFHFPTHAPKAYPPNRPVWLQPDRMDLPAMTVFGRAGAGDDRRGRPGITSRTFAKQVRHVCAPFRRVIAGMGTSAGGIKSRRVIVTYNQRRRVRAQNAATPRRSSVPCPPRRPQAGRALGVSFRQSVWLNT